MSRPPPKQQGPDLISRKLNAASTPAESERERNIQQQMIIEDLSAGVKTLKGLMGKQGAFAPAPKKTPERTTETKGKVSQRPPSARPPARPPTRGPGRPPATPRS